MILSQYNSSRCTVPKSNSATVTRRVKVIASSSPNLLAFFCNLILWVEFVFFFNEGSIHYIENCGNLLRCKTTSVAIKDFLFPHQHKNIFLENPFLTCSCVANGSE